MVDICSLIDKKYEVLDKGFICLVDVMGRDVDIVRAAKTSYGREDDDVTPAGIRKLIRYLMSHNHTTPFEMVEFKFLIQAPMDCWRQWIRHRTANVNEYSTRYTEALDFFQETHPDQWRLQATDNKQGSEGFLSEHSGLLSAEEKEFHGLARAIYQQRLEFGVAKEQARKDLPLSTYTRAYWKCDLHNIFNFLRLRMDSHAQLEIRSYANAMYKIVKQVVPVACEAFEDYVLNACRFSAMEMKYLRELLDSQDLEVDELDKPDNMTDREWISFKKKVSL
jgi:thymidylate synthase (FAD)